jgi:16S rRNA (cytidine1402-2'-O)-methyltransferase
MEDKTFKLEAGLYIVPTPIGNLGDITIRALDVLRNADIIACEDTRHTGMLLKHYSILNKKTTSYHEHNEKEKAEYLAGLIESGTAIALVTDAGTPGISDPAYRIIKACVDRNLLVVPLPGATAFVPALLASGFGTDSFVFMGFPPHKKGRQTFIKNILNENRTVILYESVFRIEKLLKELNDAGLGEKKICIARELTKLHEEFIRGTVSECISIASEHKNLKGEFVVVIDCHD